MSGGRRDLRQVLTLGLAIGVFTLAPLAGARQAFDRTKVPPPGKTPDLRVPAWTKTTLANGADLIVSEKHDLPLVSFTITFLGGANQFEPPDRTGVALLTASMLSEGTKAHSGEALSNALQLLGTSVSVNVGTESGTMGFVSTAGKLALTLDLVVEMLTTPTFPAEAFERLRVQQLVALTQATTQPASISGRVLRKVVYGSTHPYGRVPTEASLKAITRDDVMTFHSQYFRPGRALVTVVGDVTAATVKPIIEKALAPWPKGGSRPAFSYQPLPERTPTTIFLVDRPGAVQSSFDIGHAGPPRSTPDYHAVQVMNAMLGGMFQSRLNANLREDKGYSFGVGSVFSYGKGPGAFRTGGAIVGDKTDKALVEFLKELRGILGARPVTDEELQTVKDSLIQRLPGTFASVSNINSALTTLWAEGLPDDYYQRYAKAVAAVTKDDVLRAAKKHIDMDRLAIVIVGDRASVEAPLRAVGVAPIAYVDVDGNPTSDR